MHKFMFGLVFVAFAVFSSGCGKAPDSALCKDNRAAAIQQYGTPTATSSVGSKDYYAFQCSKVVLEFDPSEAGCTTHVYSCQVVEGFSCYADASIAPRPLPECP